MNINNYVAGRIVGVGAINNPFEGRKKADYEDAFEYFLSQKYSLNEMEKDVEEGKEVEEPSLYENKALGTLFYKDEEIKYIEKEELDYQI